MDGLLVKINFEFLKELENRGLKVSSIRVKFRSRDTQGNGLLYKTYADYTAFINDSEIRSLLADRRYLCSAGAFPVVENITINNKNLTFSNRFAWYNITGSRTYTKTVTYDISKKTIYEAQLTNYITLMNTLMNTYTGNVNNAIRIRLDSYLDPCYVDAGYVSPNSEPNP